MVGIGKIESEVGKVKGETEDVKRVAGRNFEGLVEKVDNEIEQKLESLTEKVANIKTTSARVSFKDKQDILVKFPHDHRKLQKRKL